MPTLRFLRCVVPGWMAAAAAVAMVTAPASASAQTVTVDPGMTRDQVIYRLGEPSEESHAGSFTYLMYDNECGQACGMDYLVVLERGVVTDAIFRSGNRVYSGTSSSPKALPPTPPAHFAPEPIRASTPADSAHRGGIVLMGPRPPARPPGYIRVSPNRSDSARMASGTSPPTGAGARADTSAPPPHE